MDDRRHHSFHLLQNPSSGAVFNSETLAAPFGDLPGRRFSLHRLRSRQFAGVGAMVESRWSGQAICRSIQAIYSTTIRGPSWLIKTTELPSTEVLHPVLSNLHQKFPPIIGAPHKTDRAPTASARKSRDEHGSNG
jgi:hypothetical protein